MKCEALICDLFGTLVDPLPHEARHGLQVARAVGAPSGPFALLWRETAHERMSGRFASIEDTVAHICARLGIRPSPEDLGRAASVRQRELGEFMTPRPDALVMLRAVKRGGLRTGLISNAGPEVSEAWRETLLATSVDGAIFSFDAGKTKPDPDIFLLACKQLDIQPDACVYVGDGGDDELSGAESVGMRAILLRVEGDLAEESYRREAREWKGRTVTTLTALLPFVL